MGFVVCKMDIIIVCDSQWCWGDDLQKMPVKLSARVWLKVRRMYYCYPLCRDKEMKVLRAEVTLPRLWPRCGGAWTLAQQIACRFPVSVTVTVPHSVQKSPPKY